MRLRALLAMLALAVLAACSPDTPAIPTAAAPADAVLARFEQADWPQPFAFLSSALGPDKSWVLLAQVPAPVPFDLSSPAAAQAAMQRLAAQPWRILRAGTALGHVMAGWSCAGGARGLVAKTGALDGQPLRMLMAGWGLSTALATYLDGSLQSASDLSPAQLAILSEGRGHLIAIEVSAQDCAALRDALADYVTHPDNPAGHYGLLGPVAAMSGDGCIAFAQWLAGRGGAVSGLDTAFDREVPLRSSYIGTGTVASPDVSPFRAVLPDGSCPAPITPQDLRDGPWDAGAALGSVTILDPELLFAGLTALRQAAGLPSAWHLRRSLPATDPGVARAQAAVLDWARGWPQWRAVRRGSLAALVLERRL